MTKATVDDLRVLIVENDPDVLLGCEQALQLEGMPTIGAGSVEEALRRIAEARPGVIVSDVRLPGRDGLSLLKDMQAADVDLLIAPLAEQLGADDVVCNRLEMRKHKATGRLEDPVIGGNVAGQWARAFAAEHGIDLGDSWAYGASAADSRRRRHKRGR